MNLPNLGHNFESDFGHRIIGHLRNKKRDFIGTKMVAKLIKMTLSEGWSKIIWFKSQES